MLKRMLILILRLRGVEEAEGDDAGDDSEVDQTEPEDQGEEAEVETRVHELESQDTQRSRRPRAMYQGKPVCGYLWRLGKCLHMESCAENYSHPPDILGFKAKFFEDNGIPDPQKQRPGPYKRATGTSVKTTTATAPRDNQNPRVSQSSRKELCSDWLFQGECEHRNVDCEALHPMKWQGKGCKHGNECKFLNTESGCKFYHAGKSSDPRNTTVRRSLPRGPYQYQAQGQGQAHGQAQGTQGYVRNQTYSQQPVFSEQYIEQAASHVMKLLQQQQQQQQSQQSVYVPGLVPGLGLPGLGLPGLVPGFVPGTVPMQTNASNASQPMHQLAVPMSQDMSLGPGQQSVNIRLMPVKPPVNLAPGSQGSQGSQGYKQSSLPQSQGSKQSHGNRTQTR